MAKTKYPPTESLEQLMRARDAWRRHAPEASYGDRPLNDLGAGIDELQNLEQQIVESEARLNAQRDQRDKKLAEWMQFLPFIKHGVAADVRFGEDSVYFEELGYVRKSERKVAKRRKKDEADQKAGSGSKTA